ncbi:MAG: hemolysin family protein [Saprospiraceae bacterium]
MTLLITYFTIAISISFLCSIWEAVLLSITPSFVNRQLEEGTNLGETLQTFKEDIDRPLSAILTLNTIAHTVGAIMVGAQASKVFDTATSVSFLGFNFTIESIIAALMTLAILVLSEIIPKTLGANYWRKLATPTVSVLKVIVLILTPFIWLSMLITKNLKSKGVKSVFSRADFLAMASLGKKSGALKENESAIIENLLHLNKLKAKDIMTPRTMMFMADQNMTLEEFYESRDTMPPFSRIPIFDEDRDDIKGIILKNEILTAMLEGRKNEKLESISRPLAIVNENKELPHLFEFLSKNRSHIAAVSDEYGSIVGLVTLEDLFETILGFEIMDESDNIPDLQQYARKKWEERAQKMGLLEEPKEDE